MAGGYGKYPADGLQQLIARLEKAEAELAAVRKAVKGIGVHVDAATNSVIVDAGRTLKVIDAAGTVIGLLGKFSDGTEGVGFWRSDGTAAFQSDPNFSAIYDKLGNPVLSDDYKHGSGLATPWVSGGLFLANTNTATWPQTTNGTFTDIMTGNYLVQNPRLQWDIQYVADTGTTGEIRLLVNGTQVDATQTVSSTFATWTRFNVALPAGINYRTIPLIQLQARRTGGTGIVYAMPQRFGGDQSP